MNPLTTVQALALALVQGVTELFPVSSLGHAVIVPRLFNWGVDETQDAFVPYLVLLHLGTATALLILYRVEWIAIIRGFIRAAIRGEVREPNERLAMLLVVGTIPAGLIGFFAEKPLKGLFASPRVAASFLIVNGAILLTAELLRRRSERSANIEERPRDQQEHAFGDIHGLGVRAAAIVGLCQALALFPGISRAGVTMAGGLVAGLRHEEAAHFSFLLATPIITAAGVLEVPQLIGANIPLGTYLICAVLSGAAAYASARFLLRYFKSGRMDPYAGYCAVLGVVTLVVLR